MLGTEYANHVHVMLWICADVYTDVQCVGGLNPFIFFFNFKIVADLPQINRCYFCAHC